MYGINECKDISSYYKLVHKINREYDMDRRDKRDIAMLNVILKRYYMTRYSVRLLVKNSSIAIGKWNLSKESSEGLDKSGIESFRIDIEDINSKLIKDNYNRITASREGINGKYCVVVEYEGVHKKSKTQGHHASPREHYRRGTIRHYKNDKTVEISGTIVNKGVKQVVYKVSK